MADDGRRTRAVYPCTIIPARYQGVYEGGMWACFLEQPEMLPAAATSEDIECAEWWSKPTVLVAVGDTPDEALQRLTERVDNCTHEWLPERWASYDKRTLSRSCRWCRAVEHEPNPEFEQCEHAWHGREVVYRSEPREGRPRHVRLSEWCTKCGGRQLWDEVLPEAIPVEVADLPERLAQLLGEIADGGEILLTLNGAPVAQLVEPTLPAPARHLGQISPSDPS